MTPERATAPVAAITDMANHLRRVVVNRGAGTISVQSKLLLQAADECDRFYSGMVNWKANAVEKDAEIIRLRTALAAASQAQAEPVARAIHYPECWDVAAYPTVESAVEAVYAYFRCTVETQRAGIAGCTAFRDDECEQTRRAIVMAAAEIGRAASTPATEK